MKRRVLMLLALVLTLGGCASMRRVEVGSDAGTSYAVDVTNTRSATVNISYEDQGRSIPLGSVSPGRTEQFVIASPSSLSISITARTPTGGFIASYNAALRAGTTARITVR